MKKMLSYPFVAVMICASSALAQWTAVGLAGKNIYALTADTKNIVAGTDAQGVWRSTNNGAAWDSINKNIVSKGILTLYTNGATTIAGTSQGVCYTATDSNAWTSAVSGLSTLFTRAVLMKGNAIFAGTEGGGFFSAVQLGGTWTANNSGLTTTTVRTLTLQGTNLIAGTTSGIFRSTNDGVQWTALSTGLLTSSSLFVRAVVVYGSTLVSGTQGGIYTAPVSTGIWTKSNIGLTDTSVEALYVSGTTIYAGTSGGVYQSTNGGANWSAMNTGYLKEVRALVKKDNYLYAGTFGDGVYRYPVASSGVAKERKLPSSIALYQNYPNPFNPSTTIRYGLPVSSRVSIKIYNVLGQQISDLINSEQSAGWYEITWSANVASGMYLYRIEAVSSSDPSKRFVDVKKMILMR
ncbi:MAG: T9SS type A sorting domain-containing protein [Ignavibacteriales bacterium]|nr:T9SS type A sorting domain-containing protein [Ignavibacteriales bacterium]